MMCFGGVKLLRTQTVSYTETRKNPGGLILNLTGFSKRKIVIMAFKEMD